MPKKVKKEKRLNDGAGIGLTKVEKEQLVKEAEEKDISVSKLLRKKLFPVYKDSELMNEVKRTHQEKLESDLKYREEYEAYLHDKDLIEYMEKRDEALRLSLPNEDDNDLDVDLEISKLENNKYYCSECKATHYKGRGKVYENHLEYRT